MRSNAHLTKPIVMWALYTEDPLMPTQVTVPAGARIQITRSPRNHPQFVAVLSDRLHSRYEALVTGDYFQLDPPVDLSSELAINQDGAAYALNRYRSKVSIASLGQR